MPSIARSSIPRVGSIRDFVRDRRCWRNIRSIVFVPPPPGRCWNVEQVRLLREGERSAGIFAAGTSIAPIVLSAHGLDPAWNGVSKTNFHVIFDLCGAGDFRDQHEKRRLLLD